jgi:quercetin dioxygenase-like cupin family protein
MSQKELDELTREGYSCHTWSNGPGFWYPVHDHPYDKAIVVLQGSITFYLPEKKKEVLLKAGDRLYIPLRTDHSASVGAEGVTCLEGQK